MKKIFYTLVLSFLSISILAQAPQMFNYQAVLRNNAGEPIASESVTVNIEILQGSATGTVVFSETHNTETNEFGLINLQIGSVQSLDAVDWGADEYFIEVSVDGTSMGTTQLLSVPYALHAGTAVETDPVFEASPAAGIGDDDIDNWDEAYLWGDHTEEGYLTEETQSLADVLLIDNSANAQIKNLTDPTYAQDAATKAYVDLLLEKIEALEIETGLIAKDVDGNIYKTVKIGEQRWMAENLRVTKYKNGDAIPTDLNNTEWGDTEDGAYAIYDHNASNTDGIDSPEEMVEAYGKLYNWYAVNDARGLCPAGWRVPTDPDWTELVDYVVAQGHPNSNEANGAANALKSCRQIDHPDGGECATSEHPRWNSDGTHSGFDEFGFSALPGGYRWSGGNFISAGYYGYWWSSTAVDASFAWNRNLNFDSGHVDRYNIGKRDGFSVRCLKEID